MFRWWKRGVNVDRTRLTWTDQPTDVLGRAAPEWLPEGLLIRTLVRVVSFGRLDWFLFGTIGRFINTRLLHCLLANILSPKVGLLLLHSLHQRDATLVVEHNNLHTIRTHYVLCAKKSFVFSHNYAFYAK